MTETIPYTLPPEVGQLDAEWREYLVGKLDRLHEDSEWDERDKPVTAESIATFVRLILHVKPVNKPSLGLDYSGKMVLHWGDGNSNLNIICYPKGDIYWAVVRFKIGKTQSGSGSCQPQDLLAALALYGPERWVGG